MVSIVHDSNLYCCLLILQIILWCVFNCSLKFIICWSIFGFLEQENHKGLLVEQYHRYLNKNQTIAGQDCGTHLSILQNSKTSQYAWNSAPINNTDVPHSLAAVGREFRFQFDIEINGIPNLINANGTTIYNYLCGVSSDSSFSTSDVQVLVEERR